MGVPRFYYDNRLNDGTPAASTTASGYDVLNLRDFRTGSFWKPTALPATVTVDCGSALAASSFAVWGHDLFTQGATIEVRGSTDNFSSSNVLVSTYTPTSDLPFIRTWASVSYRYWRIRITGSTMPSLAITVIGSPLEMPVYLEDGFDPLTRDPSGVTNRSVSGNPLGRTIEFEEWAQTLEFKLVTWDWLRSTWEDEWDDWIRDNAFIFAWDYDNYPDEIRLAVVRDKFTSPHHPGKYADLMLDVVGIHPS